VNAVKEAMTDLGGDRVQTGDWEAITAEVNEYGGAQLPQLLTPDETAQIRELYERDDLVRSTINMGRHRFGEGQYRYFNTPYPDPVERLKQALYPRLLPVTRDWWTKLGRPAPWPDTLDEWLRMCHDAGQTKSLSDPAPLRGEGLERPAPGPARRPGVPSSSGHQPQRARRRPHRRRVPPGGAAAARAVSRHGHGYLFTTRDRPVKSARGWSAAPVRHGVSVVRSGEQHTLALVFHDAA
jgi:hypothetical protein